jgi:hypothetical protein
MVAAEGCLHNCRWEGGKHGYTAHPQHLLIQEVLYKHGSHTPVVSHTRVVSASVLPALWPYACNDSASMVVEHLLSQQVFSKPGGQTLAGPACVLTPGVKPGV